MDSPSSQSSADFLGLHGEDDPGTPRSMRSLKSPDSGDDTPPSYFKPDSESDTDDDSGGERNWELAALRLSLSMSPFGNVTLQT